MMRMEKLDEERHSLQQQMQRLQGLAVDDEPAAGMPRFSRAAPPGGKGSTGRRLSATELAPGGKGRATAVPKAGGGKGDDESYDVGMLSDMVSRGRRRTLYNQRSTERVTEGDVGGPSAAVTDSSTFVRFLPRGGVYVMTKHGAVQFGLPPETIKDSMTLGLDVPGIFVVPKDRFNLKYGTNCCECEFPLYFNFFVKGRSTVLVCQEQDMDGITSVIDECLEGPAPEYLHTDDEYSAFVDDETYEGRPDHEKEINYFKEPRGGRVISTATLVSFVTFGAHPDASDPKPAASLPCEAEGGSLTVVDEGERYLVVVDGEVVATVEEFLATAISDPPHILIRSQSEEMLESFEPPDLGVSVLGSADGFSKDGTTAGFVLWMRGRGVLVDPPAHSSHYLRESGISSRKITHVILTHCHADHDAGTFQKILLEQRVTVLTTKTIMASFIRKYALVVGLPEDFLLRLFVFHPVKIHEPVHFQDGTITFFYAMHALPCVGFRAELAGKTINYSADTFYDPDGLLKLQERGIISEGRRQSLLHHGSVRPSDLLLHEAGVPPIHTPPAALLQLPEETRRNLRLIHLSDARAQEAGIEKVRAGFEHTIRVDVPPSPHAHATAILQMLLATDLFRSLDVGNAIEVLQVTQRRTYAAGERICAKGAPGDYLRIIQSGVVIFERDGTSKQLGYCDYFGEGELLVADGKHLGTATAKSKVVVIEVSKADFQYLMSRRPLLKERVTRRHELRYAASWKAIAANSVFGSFSMAQVTQLQSIIREESVRAGQVLWKRGEPVKDVVLVGEGLFFFKEVPLTEANPFAQGALLVDVWALEHKKAHRLTFVAKTDGKIFRFGGSDLLEFLDNNPGAFIWMRDTILVE